MGDELPALAPLMVLMASLMASDMVGGQGSNHVFLEVGLEERFNIIFKDDTDIVRIHPQIIENSLVGPMPDDVQRGVNPLGEGTKEVANKFGSLVDLIHAVQLKGFTGKSSEDMFDRVKEGGTFGHKTDRALVLLDQTVNIQFKTMLCGFYDRFFFTT